jgi:hypothetical protein
MTACALNGQAGICCNQDCKVGGNCCNDNDCPSGKFCKNYACQGCSSNEECPSGQCCLSEIGGSDTCVSAGYISGKYLCDPPEWDLNGQIKTQSIFGLILNLFSQFFLQR